MNELKHLAIIMDGNGRWAKKRAWLRSVGHEAGANSLENIVIFCAQNGIKFLTLYAFSTENWKRPQSEIDFLMKLLKDFLIKKRQMFIKNNIKFTAIGDLSKFSQDLQDEINSLKCATDALSGLNLALGLNYGSKDEIIRAANKAIKSGAKLDENSISANLDASEFGDVDLLIRTGGEKRLSNFLLWQASYAELAFTDTLWPDFTAGELETIINNFKQTHRKFGGI